MSSGTDRRLRNRPARFRLRPIFLRENFSGVSSHSFCKAGSPCLFIRGPPPGVAAPAGLPVGLGADLAPRLAGNRRLATVLALAKQLGPLSLFLSVAQPVLPALRGPVPSLFVLPARFPRGFGVLGPGGRRSLPVTFGLRLGRFLPGAFGLLPECPCLKAPKPLGANHSRCPPAVWQVVTHPYQPHGGHNPEKVATHNVAGPVHTQVHPRRAHSQDQHREHRLASRGEIGVEIGNSSASTIKRPPKSMANREWPLGKLRLLGAEPVRKYSGRARPITSLSKIPTPIGIPLRVTTSASAHRRVTNKATTVSTIKTLEPVFPIWLKQVMR